MAADSPSPKLVFLFYGKRKSGKDYVVSRLQELISRDVCDVITLSAPLKRQYAEDHGLDYQRLLDSSSYKESHHLPMIAWGESMRDRDEGFLSLVALH
jgi:phosphomevalonate kinase